MAAAPRWIMDGELGPYDALAPRLRRADTVLVLDFPLVLCAWCVARRGPERLHFCWWVLRWRLHDRQPLLRVLALQAPDAEVHVLQSPSRLAEFLSACQDPQHP